MPAQHFLRISLPFAPCGTMTQDLASRSETRFRTVILGDGTMFQGAIAYSVLLILSTEEVLPL